MKKQQNFIQFGNSFFSTSVVCSNVTTPGQLWAMPKLPFGLPRLPCLQIDKTFYLYDIDAVGQLPWLPRLPFYSGYPTGCLYVQFNL